MFRKAIIRSIAEMQLDTIRKYANEMENTNTFKSQKLSRVIEEQSKTLTEEELDICLEYIQDDLIDLNINFPSLLRYSVVVATYSTMEEAFLGIVKPHMANRYKDELKLNRNFDKRLNELVGKSNLLKQLGIYMAKEMDFEFPFNSKEWKFLMDLNIIRNNIVHCNGRTWDDKYPERLKRVIALYDSINYGPNKEIVLEREFISFMISQVEKFLFLLLEPVNFEIDIE
ncbi:hypothetical protein [Bacillus mycoides]|uniref:hypothetical protein n=1 Tax=Bacillus mycoides TaxID=1405 RepID=UPI003D1AD92D